MSLGLVFRVFFFTFYYYFKSCIIFRHLSVFNLNLRKLFYIKLDLKNGVEDLFK